MAKFTTSDTGGDSSEGRAYTPEVTPAYGALDHEAKGWVQDRKANDRNPLRHRDDTQSHDDDPLKSMGSHEDSHLRERYRQDALRRSAWRNEAQRDELRRQDLRRDDARQEEALRDEHQLNLPTDQPPR